MYRVQIISQGKLYQIFEKQVSPMQLKLFQRITKETFNFMNYNIDSKI